MTRTAISPRLAMSTLRSATAPPCADDPGTTRSYETTRHRKGWCSASLGFSGDALSESNLTWCGRVDGMEPAGLEVEVAAVAEQTARVPRLVKVAMVASAVATVAALLGAALLREGPAASGG